MVFPCTRGVQSEPIIVSHAVSPVFVQKKSKGKARDSIWDITIGTVQKMKLDHDSCHVL